MAWRGGSRAGHLLRGRGAFAGAHAKESPDQDRSSRRGPAGALRSGDLVEVSIPAAQTEAMRDLERSREDAIQVERVARQQLDKFLLRHGRRWSEGGK